MPNYKLSQFWVRHITHSARVLVNRHTQCFHNGFPLSRDELQRTALDAESIELINQLKARGFNSTGTSSRVYLTVKLADMKRTATLNVVMDGTTIHLPDAYKHYRVLAERLDLGSEEKLTKWCNDAIRAKRIEEMAYSTIGKVFESNMGPRGPMITSTGAVMANWPMIANVVQDASLKDRMRNAPTRLRRFKWDDHIEKEMRPRIKAVDTIMQAAQMLGEAGKSAISATVNSWERLDSDPSFT